MLLYILLLYILLCRLLYCHVSYLLLPLQDLDWQVLVLVLMKSLSIKRVFSLQDTFESRIGLTALKSLLDASDFTDEMFDALLEVLMEG